MYDLCQRQNNTITRLRANASNGRNSLLLQLLARERERKLKFHIMIQFIFQETFYAPFQQQQNPQDFLELILSHEITLF